MDGKRERSGKIGVMGGVKDRGMIVMMARREGVRDPDCVTEDVERTGLSGS